jgi:hypothetical protein
MDIAELLTSDKAADTKTETAPNPLTHPEQAIAHHRKQWPLNQKVVDGDLPEAPEGSDRVRLRRMAEQMAESGIAVSGSFTQGYTSGGNIQISCSFSGSGDMWSRNARITVLDSGAISKKEMLELMQQALHTWGFAAVGAMDETLTLSTPGDEEEVMWDEVGLRPGYIGHGVDKPTPAKMLQYATALGATSSTMYGVSDWATGTFTPEQSREWVDKGIRTYREATGWQAIRLDADGAKEWMDAGIHLNEAKFWKGAGYTPATAKPWADVTRSYTQASEWIDGGYTPEQAAMWISFCGRGLMMAVPSDVQILIDAKVRAKQLQRLADAGCNGAILEPLDKWVGRYKITLVEALEWAELGPEFIGPGKRGRWHKAGFTPEEIRKWQKALGHRGITLDEVKAKITVGFDPELGSDWVEIHPGFSDATMIATWTEAGLAPADAKPWTELSRSFCNYHLVKDWADAGLGVMDAKPWIDANSSFYSYPLVQSWEEADPRLKGNPEAVAELAKFTRPELVIKTLETLGEAGK